MKSFILWDVSPYSPLIVNRELSPKFLSTFTGFHAVVPQVVELSNNHQCQKLEPYMSHAFTSTTKLALESVCTEALVIPDCEDSVLIQEALELVLRMLAELPPLLSRSPVLRCFRILCITQLKPTITNTFHYLTQYLCNFDSEGPKSACIQSSYYWYGSKLKETLSRKRVVTKSYTDLS
jgi:hypothetical protein